MNNIAINNYQTRQFLARCGITEYRKTYSLIHFDRALSIPTHAHTCLDCDVIIDLIPLSEVECENDADHDFARCGECDRSVIPPTTKC